MTTQNLFIACNGTVAAIDPMSGRELWRTKLRKGILSGTSNEDVCILEHEGRVYAGCNGHLFCLDAGTGALIWENGLEGMGYNDVTLAIAGKCVQFIAKHTHSTQTTS